MEELARLRYERECQPRRYWCPDCGWNVKEGSICAELDDQPEGEPEPGRTGKIHIDPKRQQAQRDFLVDWFENKWSPTPAEFRRAAHLATEHLDQDNLKIIDELLASVGPLPTGASGSLAKPSEVLPPAMIQALRETIQEVIGDAMKRAQKEIFTKEEAAEFLGLSVSSIEKQVATGKLRRSGHAGVLRFRLEDLRQYAALTPPPTKKKNRKKTAAP